MKAKATLIRLSVGSNTQAKTGSFLAGAFVRNEVTGPTLLEIFYELDRMRVLPVRDEELNAAKEYSTGNFSVELASQQGLAGRINTIYTYDLDKRFIKDFRPKIEALDCCRHSESRRQILRHLSRCDRDRRRLGKGEGSGHSVR